MTAKRFFVSQHIVLFILCLVMLVCARHIRDPQWSSFRDALRWGCFACGFLLLLHLKIKRSYFSKFIKGVCLVWGLGCFLSYAAQEIAFYYKKQFVLQAPLADVQKWGQHFVVGYKDSRLVEELIKKGAVGGVYITQRNIEGKTFAEMQALIAHWQSLQGVLSLPRLIVTADQEGGAVSHLSPILTRTLGLSSLVDAYQKGEKEKLIHFAHAQAVEMRDLGLTMNLAPVVDLQDELSLQGFDLYSQIYKRAIDKDPQVVGGVALAYCQELERLGIRATLKHFPGLGSVSGDTHLQNVVATRSEDDFKNKDWQPYQQVFHQCNPAVMVSHTIAEALDPHLPSSLSSRIIQKYLRQELKFTGLIITDDFSMQPISGRAGGVGLASVQALRAGVDLILLSYDPDLYFEAMYVLLRQG